ncbi:hypothetical protein BDZ88DRAFT_80610 [Geranomyces variabilis]|nr:hypothetical protein BDZ88DRAFT_80610 [Geranomyces variabilis]KAJ3134770.1 hypothetical protein HDU90_004800 [Geranomyces variabilis]
MAVVRIAVMILAMDGRRRQATTATLPCSCGPHAEHAGVAVMAEGRASQHTVRWTFRQNGRHHGQYPPYMGSRSIQHREHGEEYPDISAWRRNPGFDDNTGWARPRPVRVQPQRPSLTADLHARELRAEREDAIRSRTSDYTDVSNHGNTAYTPETSATSMLRPQYRVSIMRVDDRPSLAGPRSAMSSDVRVGPYNPPPRRTLWEQPQSLWRQNSQWDAASPSSDRQPRESERFDSGMRLDEAQDLGHLTTPIKPRRGATPVESPVSGSAPWLAPNDGGFTYFARGIGAPSPSARDPAAGSSSMPAQSGIPKDSLAESSDRLGEIEEEIAKYREMLRTLQSTADNDSTVDITTATDGLDDITNPGTPAASAEDEGSAEELQDSAADSDAMETDLYETAAVVDESWALEDTAAGKILQENRRQALESEAELAFKIPVHRLVGDVSSLSLVRENIETHQRVKASISKKVAKRFAANQRKRQKLTDAYTQHLADWRKKIEDQEAEAEALAQEAAKKKRKLGKAAGPASGLSRGSRRSAFSSDMVRTEAEFQEALAMLGDNDIDHDPNKSAVEPSMIIDPVMRQLIKYKDENNLVADPAGDMRRYNARLGLIWSEDEQRALRQLLSRYRKSFSTIASHLPRKSTKDVVHFYYREKHKSLRSVIAPRPGKVQKRRDRVGEEEEGQQPKGNRRGRGKEAATGRKDPAARRGPRGAAAAREAVGVEEVGDDTTEQDAMDSTLKTTTLTSTVVSTTQNGSESPLIVTTESELRTEEVTTELRRPSRRGGDSRRQSSMPVDDDMLSRDAMNDATPPVADSNAFAARESADLRDAADGEGRQQRKRGASTVAAGVNLFGGAGAGAKRKNGTEEGSSGASGPALNDTMEGDVVNNSGGIDASRASPHAKRTISYWNSEETISFRDAYASFGKDWESVALRVGSKSAKQAQNYYKRNQMEMDLIRLSDSRLRSGGAGDGASTGLAAGLADLMDVGDGNGASAATAGADADGIAGAGASSAERSATVTAGSAVTTRSATAAASGPLASSLSAATPHSSLIITLNAAPRIASRLTALFGFAGDRGADAGDASAAVSESVEMPTPSSAADIAIAPRAARMHHYQPSSSEQYHLNHLAHHHHHLRHLHHPQYPHARIRPLIVHPSLLTGTTGGVGVGVGVSLGVSTANGSGVAGSRAVVSPLQAASALAAQRVAKLAQNRINSQVESFIRKQSAAATAVPAAPTNMGFAPIPRGFRAVATATAAGGSRAPLVELSAVEGAG